jgi:hypothetical protein
VGGGSGYVGAGAGTGDGADRHFLVYTVVKLELMGPVFRDAVRAEGSGLWEEDGEVAGVEPGMLASVFWGGDRSG